MLPFPKQASRFVDFLALAALGGMVIALFATFLTFAPLPMESELRRLLGAQWIALHEQSSVMLSNPDGFDAVDAASASVQPLP